MSKALPIAVAIILGGAALVPVYYANQSPATPDAKVSKLSKDATAVEKISYALGYEVAQQTPPELDMDSFITGVCECHCSKFERREDYKEYLERIVRGEE